MDEKLLIERHQLAVRASYLAFKRLHNVDDPDLVLSIMASIPMKSKYYGKALHLALRRLRKAGRQADAALLIDSWLYYDTDDYYCSVPFVAHVIHLYSNFRMFDAALRTFEDIPSLTDEPPSTTALNGLLFAYSSCHGNSAVPLIQLFELYSKKYSIVPDQGTWTFLIPRYIENGQYDKVLELLEGRAKVQPSDRNYGKMLFGFYKAGKHDLTEKVWEQIQTYTSPWHFRGILHALIQELCEDRQATAALKAFEDIITSLEKIPDFRALRVLVQRLVEDGNVEAAEAVIEKVKRVSRYGPAMVEKELGGFLHQSKPVSQLKQCKETKIINRFGRFIR